MACESIITVSNRQLFLCSSSQEDVVEETGGGAQPHGGGAVFPVGISASQDLPDRLCALTAPILLGGFSYSSHFRVEKTRAREAK